MDTASEAAVAVSERPSGPLWGGVARGSRSTAGALSALRARCRNRVVRTGARGGAGSTPQTYFGFLKIHSIFVMLNSERAAAKMGAAGRRCLGGA